MAQVKDPRDKQSGLRRRAEEALGGKSSDREDISRLSPEDVHSLVHELRVHQIELEMQNEELRQAQIKLEELKDRYLDLYDFAPVGYVTLDDKGLILEANLTAVRLLGLERQRLTNRPFSRFVCQEFGDAFYLYLQKVFEAQSKQTCEIELSREDGTQFYAQLESEAVQDENGQFSRCRTIVTDISERKRAEWLHRESEDRYRDLVENIQDLICTHDLQGNLLFVNQASATIVGYSPAELVGTDMRSFLAPEVRDQFDSYLAAIQRDGQARGLLLVQTKSGEKRLWEYRNTLSTEGPGEPIVRGFAQDITQRKKIEENLREAEQRYRRLFERAPAMYVITRNEKGIPFISDCNDLFLTSMGHTREEVQGKPLADFYSPESRSDLLAGGAYSRALAGEFFIGERQLVRSDGSLIPTLLYTATEVDPSGRVTGTRAMFVDITERKSAEEALRLSEERNRFLAGVIENSSQPFGTGYPDGSLGIVNRAFCDLTGYSEEELRHIAWNETLTPPEWLESEIQHLTELERTGKPVRYEKEYIRKDGSRVPIELLVHVVRAETGETLHYQSFLTDLTERKIVEKELRQSENRFRSMFHNHHAVMLLIEPESGQIIDANRSAQRFYGYQLPELLGMSIQQINTLSPDEIARERQRALSRELNYFVFPHRLATGEVRTVEVHSSPIDLEGQRILFSIIQDITDRKRAEEELVSSEKAYRTLAENIPGIVYRVHFDGQPSMEFFNNQVESITAFSLAELTIGEVCSIDPLILSEDRPRVIELVKEATAQNKPFEIEYRIKDKDGAIRTLLEYGRPVSGSEGAPSFIDGVIFDVTERRKVEADLKASEERYRGIFDNAAVGIDLVDAGGKIRQVNQSFAQMLGYTIDELLKMTILDITYPEDVEDSNYRHQKMVEGKTDAYRFEKRYVRKDGEVFWADVSASPVRDPDGVYEATIGVISDITARKQAEEELSTAKRDWEDTFNSIDDMVTIHDKDYNIIHYNTAAKRLLGLPNLVTSDVIKCYQLYHGKDCPPETCPSCQCLHTQRQAIFEFFEPHLNMFVEVRAIPRFDSNGQLAGLVHIVRDITERNKAEEALQTERDRVQQYLDIAGVMLVALNAEGSITMINRKGCQILGYEEEEIINRNWFNVCLPIETREEIKGVFEKLIAGDTSPAEFYENPVLRKDGEQRIVAFHNTVLYDRSSQITGILCSGEDVTEHKHREETLREREEFLSSIVENIPDMIFIKDAKELRFVRFNKAGEELLGYKREELIGKNDYDFFPKEQADSFTKKDLEVLESGQVYDIPEESVETKNGRRIIHTKKIPMLDNDGVPAYLLGISEDITERKRAEEALKASDKQYRTLFEESIDGVYSVLRDGTITDVNRSFCECFGYTSEEMIGKDIRELYRDPADRPRFQEEIEKSGFVKDYEINFQNKEGKEVDCLISSSVIFGEEGSIIGYRGIVRDLTTRKELHRQLRQAQKMEAVGTLAGGIAHDFNNILQVVLGYSELVLADEDLPDRLKNDLGKVLLVARNGAELVQRLLTFSRKTDIKPLDLDLNQRIRQTHKFLERTLPKMIDIELILTDGLARIHADPTQVDQVLMNLAVNARDAMPDGGRIVIETANVFLDEESGKALLGVQPGEYVRMSVSDTGHGMDKETLGHIFEPFYTTKEAGKGTGLGLAMVYGIVHQHGGYISCYSEPGEGTTFKIYFPAIEMEMNSDVATTGIMPAFGTETILLVDDEEFIRDLGKRILERSGYTVLTAANGKEALDLYKREMAKISLVILDVIMPEMDGKQCLKELLKFNPAAKVLVASGYSADGPTKEALQGGARGFVSKPFDMRRLLQTVRKVLDEE